MRHNVIIGSRENSNATAITRCNEVRQFYTASHKGNKRNEIIITIIIELLKCTNSKLARTNETAQEETTATAAEN